MFLNIITPVTRPKNLRDIEYSINIPKENYRWIIVHDNTNSIDDKLLPNFCEVYNYKDNNSVFGNAQRNFALNLINNGHIYFNDDDTTIHPMLWDTIKNLDHNDFISFNQIDKSGRLRLTGSNIKLDKIDSHNFIIDNSIGCKFKWSLDKYNADGIYAIKCYHSAVSPIFINKTLSIYNSLRK